MSFAILGTSARRSRARRSCFGSGSSRTLRTRSISVRSWSVGWPAHPGSATRSSARTTADARPLRPSVAIDVLLDLAEDVLGQQLLEVDRRFDLSDPPAGGDELLRSARTDTQVLFPDQPLRLDRRDRVVLQLDPRIDPEGHERLIVFQGDGLHAPDLDARDLHRRAGLQPPDRRKLGGDHVAAPTEERNASEVNRKVAQCQDADQYEQPDRDVDPRSLLHQAPSARSGSPRMNCRTTGFGDAWMTAGGPTSAIRPSCSMATVSAISKISGISWLTMTAVKRSFRWSSRIRWWMVLTRIGSRPVVGSLTKPIWSRATRATATATTSKEPPATSAGAELLIARAISPASEPTRELSRSVSSRTG